MRKLKLILASLAIALCGFSQAFAADWSAATLEAGKHYFLNVGANKWWGAGNSWGTQASLLPHPEYLTVIADGSNYKIESQVSNGGTAYYFDGSFMDNGNPASLTIETDGTNYSIANGTTYYGYDGSTTVLATSDNRDSDNFKWQIFSEAQMRARLEAASSSNPVDATYLILNQGFGRNNRNTGAWTMDASNKNLAGGDNTNLCAESYHSIFTLSQKIENVPNGLYTLTAQGFYRQDGSDNDNLPYFYINDAKGTFPAKTGAENNMTDASVSFSAGKYTSSPISVVVTDGTITLGAKNEVNTSLWCIFDNFTLTFYGDTDPLEASKTLIKATIDEAEAIDVTGLPTAVVDEMKAIVETYKTAYESYTTQAEFDQAIVAIQTAINKVKAYNNAKDCIAKLKALLEETNVYTQEAYETIYANVTKFENAELTVDEANALNGVIFGTGWHATAAIDDFLISAWDVAPRTWDSYHVNTWSTTGDSGNPNMFTPCIEYWTGDGDKLADKVMTATVAGLAPNVKYSVSILACPAVNTGENGVAPTGIELQVGEGTPVSLCTGSRIGETRFYEGTFTAEGTADAEGNLVIKINVAGTNASWLTFRNVKYTEVATPVGPDLTKYTLVKSFTAGGAVDVATGDQISITAYETGNKKQQTLYAATAPEEAAGWIAFQAVKGSGSKGWWNREGKGLYCYNANRSAAIYGESLTLGSVVVFKCAGAATKAITLTNANNEPDGTFTYQLSEDGNTYYCTITAETNAYVGFCGAKSGNYISSIEVYQPNAPVTQATYTVKYVNEEGAELKEAVSYNGIAGNSISLTDADKANITVGEDIYVYTSDDSAGKTIAADGSTVITVSFHKATNMTYTVNELCGENVARQTTGSSYETATVSVPYRRYNVVDGTLWEKGASNKEYNHKFTLTKDSQVEAISYTQTTITDVVFLSEGEDLEGATKCTNANTGIRSSNSSSAYAAEGDVMITMLPAGQYKMTAVICDVSKEGGQSMSFKIGDKDLVTITTEAVNWHQGTHEFTVYGQQPIYLAQGGSANLGLDFVYFQKTGDVAPMEVANIGALKDVPEGAEVKLALTDAVVNLWCGDYTTQSMASYIEDATGAIKFDTGLSSMEWMRDSIAMNGYIYAQYGKDYDGIPQLSVSDSTGASEVDTVAAVPASKVMTIADASTESAVSRYVKFENVVFAKKAIDEWTTDYCLVQGTDTIVFFDKFSRFGWNAMPEFVSFDEVQGFISMYDGKFEFYPYGEYKANYIPAVVVENIAAAKAVESGTNVNLTLKDAKITAYMPSKFQGGSATAFIEDASGAIQISGDVLSQFGVENDSTILNGNIYVKYVNEWGAIQLSAGDSLAYSKVEAKEGAVSPTTMAVKDIKAETNVARYVEIAFPSFKYDAENYFYYAAQNGDTIMVVDNFGWMSSNFEMDDEYNLILPDSVSSIRGIVMWDDWNGYSIAPTGIDEFVAPQDIVVNVTEGDIAAAVETAKAAVKKVGKITINLTEGAAYTVNSSIVAPAALVINGNGATIDASATTANIIEGVAETPAAWEVVDSIAVKDVTIKGLGKALYYSAAKNRNITNFLVDNSVVEVVKDVTIFDFTKGSVAMNFVVKNSTLYAPTATTKSVYSSQSGQKATEADAAAVQSFSFENSTLYNMTYNKNFFTHRQNSQKWIKYVIKNNVVVNSGKANFMTSINGGGDSANPVYEVTTNSVGTLADGVYTDLSASQTVQDNVMGTLVTSDPMFKDVANGDFTLGEASEQNTNKLGDPRWFVAAPAPSVAYLCGSTTAPDEAIYNALVAAQYDVTPLNYDEVTLTEEIVMNDFAGKYDVVVLAGGTGSGTNLAKSANILLGKVNVLSTKSFWYKHYGTNGDNPGTADAPSLSVAVSEGYAEHPLFTGIDGAEFAVFNDMGKSTGRYLQSNGSFADEAYAQTTIATTLGADCIGEVWVGDYGYVIIPVDGDQPEGYLTEDGKKLFVNAVQYLIDGVKFTTGIDGINSNVNVLNGDVYSINGIKVRKAGESLKGLAKGMYIVNGKKFIVK